MNGRRLRPALWPFTTIPMGSGWRFLDGNDPAALAAGGVANIADVIGPGKEAPFGFTVAELMRIAYGVKVFRASTTLTGGTDGTTGIFRQGSGTGFPLPGGKRELLLREQWQHSAIVLSGTDTAVEILFAQGYFYAGLYYPKFAAGASGTGGDNLTTAAPFGASPVGTCFFYGKTTPVYPNPHGAGDINVVEDTVWPEP